jgi:hypothetical protein
MRKHTPGRLCRVCSSPLKEKIDSLLIENKMSYRSIAAWCKSQGESLGKDNIFQHKRRHLIVPEISVKIAPTEKKPVTPEVQEELSYHAMIRKLISDVYKKIDVERVDTSDMLKVISMLGKLTDLVSKIEVRKIESTGVVSKLLEARAEGRFDGWIEPELDAGSTIHTGSDQTG